MKLTGEIDWELTGKFEQAIRRSGVIVRWVPCDPKQQIPANDSGVESCPDSEPSDPYGDLKDKWDGYNDVADVNAAQSQQHATDRLNRAAENAQACWNQFRADVGLAGGEIAANAYLSEALEKANPSPGNRYGQLVRGGGAWKAGVGPYVAIVGGTAGVIKGLRFRECVAGARRAGGL